MWRMRGPWTRCDSPTSARCFRTSIWRRPGQSGAISIGCVMRPSSRRPKGRRTTNRMPIGPKTSDRENLRLQRPRPNRSRRPRPNVRPTMRSGSNAMPAARGCARPAWMPEESAPPATRLSRVRRIAKLGERIARRISAGFRCGSLERPMVPFAEQFSEEADSLRPVQLHQERAEVLAHESTDRSIRPEVDAVVFDAFLLPIDEDRIVLHPAGEERLRLFVDGDEGRVNRFCRGKPVPSQEDEEERLEGHRAG